MHDTPLAKQDYDRIQEHLSKPGSNWIWLFNGDSITHGAKHTYGWRSFPEIFSERLRCEYGRIWDIVINAGVNGDASTGLANPANYDWFVRQFHPNVVILLIGCNDTRQKGYTLEGFRQRLNDLVDRIRQDGAIPVLQTYNAIQRAKVPSSGFYGEYQIRFTTHEAFNEVIRQVAAAKDTILVDHLKHWQEAADDPETLDFWLGEFIHPGPKGHLEIANLLMKELGMAEPVRFCSTLPAGGHPPYAVSQHIVQEELTNINTQPEGKALADQMDGWDRIPWHVGYDAADGLPAPPQWSSSLDPLAYDICHTYGAPALRVNLTERGTPTADFSCPCPAEPSFDAATWMALEAELIIRIPFMTANIAFAFPCSPTQEIRISLAFNKIDGSFGMASIPPLGTEEHVKLKLLLDRRTMSGLLTVNGYPHFCANVHPVDVESPRLRFGALEPDIGGRFALFHLKLGWR